MWCSCNCFCFISLLFFGTGRWSGLPVQSNLKVTLFFWVICSHPVLYQCWCPARPPRKKIPSFPFSSWNLMPIIYRSRLEKQLATIIYFVSFFPHLSVSRFGYLSHPQTVSFDQNLPLAFGSLAIAKSRHLTLLYANVITITSPSRRVLGAPSCPTLKRSTSSSTGRPPSFEYF